MRLSTCAILLAVFAVAFAAPKKIFGVGCVEGEDCTGIGKVNVRGGGKSNPTPTAPPTPAEDEGDNSIIGVGCVEGEDCTGIGEVNADDPILSTTELPMNATGPIPLDDDPWAFGSWRRAPRWHHAPRWCHYRWWWRPCRFSFDDPSPADQPTEKPTESGEPLKALTNEEIREFDEKDELMAGMTTTLPTTEAVPFDDHFHRHHHRYFWRHRWFARCYDRWGWGPCPFWDDAKLSGAKEPSGLPVKEIDCKGKEDGAYAIGCSRYFFVCLKEAMKKSECPRGMTFNAVNLSCDFFNAEIPECSEVSLNSTTTALPVESTTFLPIEPTTFFPEEPTTTL